MTLIVARILDDNVSIESDTLAFQVESTKQNLLNIAIKSVIVTPYIAVCYAGAIKPALEAIKALFAFVQYEKQLKDRQLIEILLEFHFRAYKETDFILVVSECPQPRIYKISQGVCHDDIQSAWIGDQEGFSYFQMYCHSDSHLYENDVSKMIRHRLAFRKIVEHRLCSTIDGFPISVQTMGSEKKLKYSYSGGIVVPKQIHSYGEIPTIRLESLNKDGYSYSILSSDENSKSAICIYISQLKKAFLYIPSHSLEVKEYENVEILNFVQQVKNEFNALLRGKHFDCETKGIVEINLDNPKDVSYIRVTTKEEGITDIPEKEMLHVETSRKNKTRVISKLLQILNKKF